MVKATQPQDLGAAALRSLRDPWRSYRAIGIPATTEKNKGRSYGKMLLKSGFVKLERKMAEQSHRCGEGGYGSDIGAQLE